MVKETQQKLISWGTIIATLAIIGSLVTEIVSLNIRIEHNTTMADNNLRLIEINRQLIAQHETRCAANFALIDTKLDALFNRLIDLNGK